MLNKTKEYKADKKTLMKYAIIFLVIAIPLITVSINGIIESSKKLASYEDNTRHISTYDMNGSTIIQNIMYQNAVNQKNRSIFLSMFSMWTLFLILHFYFFTNTKLLLDEGGMRLYSIYNKEPSKEFLWKDIKSIQFGNIYTSGSKIAQYQMKIIYIQKTDSGFNNTNITIPVRKFSDYNDLIKNIEQIGKKENIDVFHMDD